MAGGEAARNADVHSTRLLLRSFFAPAFGRDRPGCLRELTRLDLETVDERRRLKRHLEISAPSAQQSTADSQSTSLS
jgi:hypothetical protein